MDDFFGGGAEQEFFGAGATSGAEHGEVSLNFLKVFEDGLGVGVATSDCGDDFDVWIL